MTDIKANTNVSVSELANTPMEVTLGDLSLELRQLKIKELFGHFEQKVRSKKIQEAQEMASCMNDSKSKNEFMLSVWKNLPSGTELTDMVTDIMQSIDGISDIISLSSGVNVEDIQKYVNFNNLIELAPMVSWIIGIKNSDTKEVLNGDEEAGEDGAEKKTT